MSAEEHYTHVVAMPMPTRWAAYCSVCGVIGQPQEHKADAVDIAKRHAEIQGFERPND